MIDHVLRFNSEAEAVADPIVGAYHSDDGWRGDVCFPGQQVWKPADDIAGVDEDGNAISTPQFLPYWYITVTTGAPVPALFKHPLCMVTWDRERGVAFRSALPPEELAQYAIAPTPAGTLYPFMEASHGE